MINQAVCLTLLTFLAATGGGERVFRLQPGASGQPFREPQIAVANNLTAVAFGSGGAIYVATSKDGGTSFSEPARVAEAPILPLTRHRGPRIVLSRGAIIVTAVIGRTEATGGHSHGLPQDGDLTAWRSTDGGKTWSAGARVNDTPAAAREGLHTLAADGRGNLFAAWLDLREGATRLFGARSEDGGVTWSRNEELYRSPDGTICQCCHPSAIFTEGGELLVMFRNALGGSRDFHVLRAKDGRHFGSPEKIGEGTWKIEACPMDGGGLARAGGRTLTAWRRKDEVFLAEPGKPEVRIGVGKDVALAAGGSKTIAAWIHEGGLEVWEDGQVRHVADNAAFPTLAVLPGGAALAAWEENGGIGLRRLP